MRRFFLKEARPVDTSRSGTYSRPAYGTAVETVKAVSHIVPSGQTQWYQPVLIGAQTVEAHLFSQNYVERGIELMRRLTPDDYTAFLIQFFSDGLSRFGRNWRYADIVTVLSCLADLLAPKRYLEIGVRRGRSVAAVVSANPECALVMFDMWVEGYAGMENPGPDFVRQELKRIGHCGDMKFIDGDSHVTVPLYLARNPHESFDLITVDGDHTPEGAVKDLCDVLPRLKIGGAIVFDDVCHPIHPELGKVWHDVVATDPRYSAFTYADCGYGVGFAVRKY